MHSGYCKTLQIEAILIFTSVHLDSKCANHRGCDGAMDFVDNTDAVLTPDVSMPVVMMPSLKTHRSTALLLSKIATLPPTPQGPDTHTHALTHALHTDTSTHMHARIPHAINFQRAAGKHFGS